MDSKEPDIYNLLKSYRDLQGGFEYYGQIYVSFSTRDVMDILERYWRERIAKEIEVGRQTMLNRSDYWMQNGIEDMALEDKRYASCYTHAMNIAAGKYTAIQGVRAALSDIATDETGTDADRS
jgi:hypothetical protein